MVTYVLKGLFTFTNICRTMHAYTIYTYIRMTTRKHFVDFHELDYINLRLTEIFILNINRLIIFSFFAISIPCSVLLIILFSFLYCDFYN